MIESPNLEDIFKKKYADYYSTGGISKNMIKKYGIILLGDMVLGWHVGSLNLWLGSLCFLLSLPLLFYYRFCQSAIKTFGPSNVPMPWYQTKFRRGLIIVGLSFFALSIFLVYPHIQSVPLIASMILATFWFINRAARNHISDTLWIMEALGENVPRMSRDKKSTIYVCKKCAVERTSRVGIAICPQCKTAMIVKEARQS